jgi:hypothetical protein
VDLGEEGNDRRLVRILQTACYLARVNSIFMNSLIEKYINIYSYMSRTDNGAIPRLHQVILSIRKPIGNGAIANTLFSLF